LTISELEQLLWDCDCTIIIPGTDIKYKYRDEKEGVYDLNYTTKQVVSHMLNAYGAHFYKNQNAKIVFETAEKNNGTSI